MKKRHEILALLAAAAGLTMGTAAEASIASPMNKGMQAGIEQPAADQQNLSEMIHQAAAKGFGRSGNSNAAGSPSKSPQGNGNAQGAENSGNDNAAGSPSKSPQGSGNNPS